MRDVAAWEQAGLQYDVADGVAWLRLNRPDKANAMDHYPGGRAPTGWGSETRCCSRSTTPPRTRR
jgi:hypothetical protein